MFNPVIPVSGLGGWRFLQNTYDRQFEAFKNSVELKRDAEYFRENIKNVKSAEDLVSDRRLLSVALGAFGLQDDINNRYYIQKVLEDGSVGDDVLANRIADPRYALMSQAFGLGPLEYAKVEAPLFSEAIIDRYEERKFEIAAGEQNDLMRVALYAEREVTDLAKKDVSNDAKWFTILGEPPMRKMFEKALGLPSQVGQIDIDKQLEIFKEKSQKVFGFDDISEFSDPENVQKLITKYILREQIDAMGNGMSAGSIALSLLQS